jgi:hypothetical protein
MGYDSLPRLGRLAPISGEDAPSCALPFGDNARAILSRKDVKVDCESIRSRDGALADPCATPDIAIGYV